MASVEVQSSLKRKREENVVQPFSFPPAISPSVQLDETFVKRVILENVDPNTGKTFRLVRKSSTQTSDFLEELYNEPLPQYEEVRGEWVRYVGDCDWSWTGLEEPLIPPPAPKPHNDEWLESTVYEGSTPYITGGSMSTEKWCYEDLL